ncbi:MAG: hypothetical protein ACFE0Q_13925 [Anaerolineae bacterium]
MLNENSQNFLTWSNYLENAQRAFIGSRFSSTGSSPISYSQMRIYVNAFAGIYWNTEEAIQNIDSLNFIIVGRENFDRNFLNDVLHFISDNSDITIISQEDFLNYSFNFDEWIPYFQNDSRISNHMCLNYLASIGFKWPQIHYVHSQNEQSEAKNSWNEKSKLKEFGYSTAKGVSVSERREALRKAVSSMGLKPVAYFLVNFLINRMANNPTHAEAIERRKSDAEWLKKEFYDQSNYRFLWPT